MYLERVCLFLVPVVGILICEGKICYLSSCVSHGIMKWTLPKLDATQCKAVVLGGHMPTCPEENGYVSFKKPFVFSNGDDAQKHLNTITKGVNLWLDLEKKTRKYGFFKCTDKPIFKARSACTDGCASTAAPQFGGKSVSDLATYPTTSDPSVHDSTTGVQLYTTDHSTNTTVANCTCVATCACPNGCSNNCTKNETFVCPKGFYSNGSECVPAEDCGCYYQGKGVLQENATILVDNCTEQCTCVTGELSRNEYQCNPNAACEDGKDGHRCYCIEGYIGNDGNCTYYTDCQDVYDAGFKDDGVYYILPGQYPGLPFQVYCRSGWSVFQRRENGTVNFSRNWLDYKEGFGDVENEMWLGNDKIFYLTNQKRYKLQIYGLTTNGSYYLNYDQFVIGNEESNYRLDTLGTYNGTFLTGYMEYHRNMSFTTKDRDNDYHQGKNCAEGHKGAWWYKACYDMNLNGIYGDQSDLGICFFNRGYKIHICDNVFVEMSLKPV